MDFAALEKGKTMAKEYIEREAAINAIENDCLELVYYTKEDAIQCVKATPAADVAPVVHGRWIEKTAHDRRQYFECSNCGKQENKHTAIRGGFCWNCGAKMDKEETDELDKREG